jgi:hypothetical protein
LFAAERDASLIGSDRAADDLHQSRFASAVFTRQPKDGSARRRQTDQFQRAGCAEGLFDPRQRQHGVTRPVFANLNAQGDSVPKVDTDAPAANCLGKRPLRLSWAGRQSSIVCPQGRVIISSCHPE